MKITLLQGAFFPVPPVMGGAIEKMWYELGKGFVRQGHEVVQVSRKIKGFDDCEVIEGVKHHRVKGFDSPKSLIRLKFLDLIYTLRALEKLPEADVIVTNTFWAPFLCRIDKGELVLDVQRIPKGQLRFYPRRAYFRANSSSVVEAICNEGDFQKRTIMIPNPLPFKANKPVQFNKKKNQILYVGRIHKEKGIDLLLSALYPLLNTLLKGWEIHLVGSWEYKDGGSGLKYKERLFSRYKSPRIFWHGPVYDVEELNSYYENSKIFLYPSLAEKGETFGLSPLEAMAWGCVPVVSDLNCFKDFIVAGKNGVIFNHRGGNPQQALMRELIALLEKDLPLLSKEAIRVRETHSIDSIATDFLTLFDRIKSAKKPL